MNLGIIRKARTLSQDDLAAMTGLSKATISRAESMDSTAKLATYIKYAEALGITLSDIFCDDRTTLEVEFLRVFRGFAPEDHDHLLAMMQLARSHGR